MLENDPLQNLPGDYYRTEDLREFMNASASWMMRYIQIRLTRDPDRAGDFYLHFYERAARCLEAYRSRQHLPFTGFLATYLRHEFMNFLRTAKTKEGSEVKADDMSYFPAADERPPSPESDVPADLPLNCRIPLKLHSGLHLNSEEIRSLAVELGPGATASLLKEAMQRRMSRDRRTQKLEDRAARLNYLIHTSKAPASRLKKWKNRIVAMLDRPRPIFSYSELAERLGTSKTTISRRIDQARTGVRVIQEAL